ncbi:MAG TPA: helix-turn-helix transcriptional regulator [Thermomicrobiales bacterium]|jgi:hypothetical protein
MATELEDLARRLRSRGYEAGGALVADLGRSLRGLRLVPERLPAAVSDAGGFDAFQTREVAVDVARLRHHREARHLSKRGLARAARLSPAYVCNLESPARAPTKRVRWATVEALAKVLAIDPEDLLDGYGPAP